MLSSLILDSATSKLADSSRTYEWWDSLHGYDNKVDRTYIDGIMRTYHKDEYSTNVDISDSLIITEHYNAQEEEIFYQYQSEYVNVDDYSSSFKKRDYDSSGNQIYEIIRNESSGGGSEKEKTKQTCYDVLPPY